jgi:transcriptional regulator with XRE-family HTH domain
MTTGYQERVDTGSGTTRHRELADFLRARRERISPELAGLPTGGRRRTPGLRREEVAQLAGVGVTWYTWLEQGRDIRVSDQVLEAVARTLRLDRDERAYLFTLAGSAGPVGTAEHAVDAATLRVLDAVHPWPACVQSAKNDILAHNRAYARLVGDLDLVPPSERNTVWLMFTDPDWRHALLDWETLARQAVGRLRARWPNHSGDPSWQALVSRLRAASDEFAAMWDSHEVTEYTPEQKPIRNDRVGLLRFDLSTTWLAPEVGTRLVVYTPADDDTRARLDRLVAD